ncbi:MAG TPA: response regulator transcription factor [Paludibacter sp.]|jgi:DNA-binding response OmpR family regulator|nr:response regulator transcription factor [Bacteroidales bacterium]HOG05145.1 response regulator transcription factor [Paludibacter sp.]HOS46207.1 response regulator transcription factor [Paludibacter sp.]HPM09691.1 response regulator transcription factor [Paludibacter sp.]
MKKILVVEDDVNLGTALIGFLEMQKHEVNYVSNGDEAVSEFQRFQPDLVTLDVVLNCSVDGFEIARQIRQISDVPIIFTTSRDGNEDYETGFGIANSDYVRKPYRLVELLLRINKMIEVETLSSAADNHFRIGRFQFFPDEQSLKFSKGDIHLSPIDSSVLNLLCRNKGKFVPREEIIRLVWQVEDTQSKETALYNSISRLKKYLFNDEQVKIENKIRLGIRIRDLNDKSTKE